MKSGKYRVEAYVGETISTNEKGELFEIVSPNFEGSSAELDLSVYNGSSLNSLKFMCDDLYVWQREQPNYIGKAVFNSPIVAYGQNNHTPNMVKIRFKIYDKETGKEISDAKILISASKNGGELPKRFIVEDGLLLLPLNSKCELVVSKADENSKIRYCSESVMVDLCDIKDNESIIDYPDVYLKRIK